MRSSSPRTLLLTGAAGLGLSLLSALPAAAHGTAEVGVLGGALHPLLGLDHLALLVGIGLCAARFGPQLLGAALLGGLGGSLLGSFGVALPGAELLAALAVSALGGALLLSLNKAQSRSQRVMAAVLAGATALHGLLHGQASAGQPAWWLGAGVSSLAVVWLSLLAARQLGERSSRIAATALVLLGGAFALASL